MPPLILKRSDASLMKYTGLSYSTIYKLEEANLFPKRRQLSPGRVGWCRLEVDEWAKNLPAAA